MAKVKIKEKLYAFLVRWGVKIFYKAFPEYFAKEPLKPSDRFLEYPFITRNLPKLPARVLDVGCAGSFLPLILAGLGYESCGVDIREYAILNKIKFDNFKFSKLDIRNNSFADNYFDAITAISTIEHIGIGGRYGADNDLNGDEEAVAQMARILKPGGVLLLTVPFGKPKILKPHCRIYDYAWLKRITSGLVIEKEEYYTQDINDDWLSCSRQEAELIDSTEQRYCLCLLKLVKV